MITGMTSFTIKLSRKFWMMTIAAIFLALTVLPLLLYRSHPLPPGTDGMSRPVQISPEHVNLLIDSTAFDPATGKRVIQQVIFDEILAMIKRADRFICLDLFLWNPWQGNIPEDHRAVSTELAEALIEKKKSDPDLDILILTDPINRIYGQMEPGFFRDMEQAGIPIIFTSLGKIPDSNWLYARYWQFYHGIISSVPFLNNLVTGSLFTNPFIINGPKISLRQLGRLFLFKANHRKVVVTGSQNGGLEVLIGSFNPADGSSAHSNMALHIRGQTALHALESELDLARWSAGQPGSVLMEQVGKAHTTISRISTLAGGLAKENPGSESSPTVQWLSEQAISRSIVDLLEKAEPNDEIRIAVFYLSDRKVVEAIKKAVMKGFKVRIIIDANKDAFGIKKIGVPNRQAVAELMKLSPHYDIQVRWADTHGEQFHTKAMTITNRKTGKNILLAGSANWTRRNLQNLNLEVNLLVADAPDTVDNFNRYFDTAWSNSDGLSHTLPYEAWSETGLILFWKTMLYRFQEWSGMSTF
jgi:phosphatidylserine/phosphatidylglycerophosphate/cardiolipin synthase-like enzyme